LVLVEAVISHGDDEDHLQPKRVEGLLMVTAVPVVIVIQHDRWWISLHVWLWRKWSTRSRQSQKPARFKIGGRLENVDFVACGSNHTAVNFQRIIIYFWLGNQGQLVM